MHEANVAGGRDVSVRAAAIRTDRVPAGRVGAAARRHVGPARRSRPGRRPRRVDDAHHARGGARHHVRVARSRVPRARAHRARLRRARDARRGRRHVAPLPRRAGVRTDVGRRGRHARDLRDGGPPDGGTVRAGRPAADGLDPVSAGMGREPQAGLRRGTRAGRTAFHCPGRAAKPHGPRPRGNRPALDGGGRLCRPPRPGVHDQQPSRVGGLLHRPPPGSWRRRRGSGARRARRSGISRRRRDAACRVRDGAARILRRRSVRSAAKPAPTASSCSTAPSSRTANVFDLAAAVPVLSVA